MSPREDGAGAHTVSARVEAKLVDCKGEWAWFLPGSECTICGKWLPAKGLSPCQSDAKQAGKLSARAFIRT
jgi:hypothetical protein